VHGSTDAQKIVDNLLDVTTIFGAELPEIAWWRTELVHDVRDLLAGRLPTLTEEVC
jgi:hypothetical protein